MRSGRLGGLVGLEGGLAEVDVQDDLAAAGATVLFSSHQLDLVEDICEDVVIIDAGHIVRAGDLAELRAANKLVEIVPS